MMQMVTVVGLESSLCNIPSKTACGKVDFSNLCKPPVKPRNQISNFRFDIFFRNLLVLGNAGITHIEHDMEMVSVVVPDQDSILANFCRERVISQFAVSGSRHALKWVFVENG